MTTLAEVVPIREDGKSLRDIVGMLRSLADLIEAGGPEYEGMTQLVVVRDGGAESVPSIHGYGELGRLQDAFVLLSRGQAEVLRMLNNGGVTR